MAGMWRGYFGFGSEGRYHVIFHQKDSAFFVGLFFCHRSFHDDHHLKFWLSYRIMTKGSAKKGMVFRGLKSAVGLRVCDFNLSMSFYQSQVEKLHAAW